VLGWMTTLVEIFAFPALYWHRWFPVSAPAPWVAARVGSIAIVSLAAITALIVLISYPSRWPWAVLPCALLSGAILVFQSRNDADNLPLALVTLGAEVGTFALLTWRDERKYSNDRDGEPGQITIS
jgi:hypothetical protein